MSDTLAERLQKPGEARREEIAVSPEPTEHNTKPTRRAEKAARRRATKSLSAPQLLAARIGVFVLWLATWQVCVSQGWTPPILAVAPAEVWTFLQESVASGDLQRATSATMFATMVAFVLASVVGIVAGITLGLLPRTELVLLPYLDALNAMPRIALAPVFIIAFGITTTAKVALAFTIVVFILMFNARAGIRSADPDVMRLSKVLGATKLQMFLKVMLPVAVPSIFAGLRIGLIYSLLGVVTAEIIASKVGLGQLIMRYSGQYQLEGVFGVLLVLAVLGAFINMLMSMVEKWILRYQPPADH